MEWACKVGENNWVVIWQPSINLSISFISLRCVVSPGPGMPWLALEVAVDGTFLMACLAISGRSSNQLLQKLQRGEKRNFLFKTDLLMTSNDTLSFFSFSTWAPRTGKEHPKITINIKTGPNSIVPHNKTFQTQLLFFTHCPFSENGREPRIEAPEPC